MSEQSPRLTLADKLNRLFETIHPPGREQYSNRDVQDWLAERAAEDGDGLTISANYLLALRNGQRDNPSMRNLQAIAKFFRVDPGFLLRDDEQTAEEYADLQVLGAVRDNPEIKSILLRANEFDPETRSWLAATLKALPQTRSRRRRGEQPRDTDSH